MVLRIFIAAVAAVFLLTASTTAPAPQFQAAAETKAKAKKEPTAKQKAAGELTKKCNADWQAHKKTAKQTNRAAYNAFMKACRAKK